MLDPRKLKVGDRIRFVAMPEEWSKPKSYVPRESRAFMRAMIRRGIPSRIYEIDEFGIPWIRARIKIRGRYEWHSWGISEKTGWRSIKRRGTELAG